MNVQLNKCPPQAEFFVKFVHKIDNFELHVVRRNILNNFKTAP